MLVSFLKNPSLSASRIATSATSGRSKPSRKRLMPTSTSTLPRRRSLKISVRFKVFICRRFFNLGYKIFNLIFARSYFYFRVQKPGRTDQLFGDERAGFFKFVLGRRGGYKNNLINFFVKF